MQLPLLADIAVVFVDPLMAHGWVLRGRATKSCHMWAAPEHVDELHALAARIGLKRKWYQERKRVPHYDLTPSKRAAAIKAGAKALDRNASVASWRQHWPR